MPLASDSLSHGTIAFGFFQIETDMLLLDRLFFFADDFCAAVTNTCAPDAPATRSTIDGFRIDDPRHIGDLHGAIAGVRFTGFIGVTYARFPFPTRQSDFKQNPEPGLPRADVLEMIRRFGTDEDVVVEVEDDGAAFRIGPYVFDRAGFARLIAYVDRGGYPRWLDDIRPPYVTAMMEKLPDDLRPPA